MAKLENSAEFKVAFTERQIGDRIQELASQITRDYDGKQLHLLGVLEEGLLFLADLVRALDRPVTFDAVKMTAADSDKGVSSVRNMEVAPLADVAGKHVLLVSMLADSGIMLDYLFQQVLRQKPQSLRIAVLIDRENSRHLPFSVDYAGFRWGGNHLVGYGLEYKGMFRNLPYIAERASLNDGGDAN